MPPIISATRQVPAVPAGVQKDVAAPSPDVLRARTRAQGPPAASQSTFPVPAREDSLLQKEQNQEQQRQAEIQRKEKEDQARRDEALRREREEQRREEIARARDEERRAQQQRQQEREREREREQERQLREREKEEQRPPLVAQSKSAPQVQPLQPTKKVQIQAQEKPKPLPTPGGGVAAAEAALTKPKEKRISAMTEVQIMEKLRSVVSEDDPKTLYSKIKKVGQGYVVLSNVMGENNFFYAFFFYSVLLGMSMWRKRWRRGRRSLLRKWILRINRGKN